MFNLGDNKGRYHRFQYHPRNYDEREEKLEKRKEFLKEKTEDSSFDVLNQLDRKQKKESTIRFDLIILGAIFFLHIIFFNEITEYFKTKYKFAEAVTYISLILSGFIFIKRSKKKNA